MIPDELPDKDFLVFLSEILKRFATINFIPLYYNVYDYIPEGSKKCNLLLYVIFLNFSRFYQEDLILKNLVSLLKSVGYRILCYKQFSVDISLPTFWPLPWQMY